MSFRLGSHTVLGLALIGSLGGCADWPRWSHLPQPDPSAIDAPTDPGSLIQRTWVPLAEAGDEPWDPTQVQPIPLDRTDATVVEGTLDGIGWSDVAAPRQIRADAQCSDASAPRNPTTEGDWLADVDAWVVTAPAEGGALCASLALQDTDVGWDLLLAKLDDCQVPTSFVQSGSTWLGYSQSGAGGGWVQALDAGSSYAVFIAGYHPNAHTRQVPYRLGLALVGPSDVGVTPCPQMPSDGP